MIPDKELYHHKPVEEKKNHKWAPPFGIRTAERKALLLVGDCLAATLALLAAIYFWAAGDRWLGLSAEFFSIRIPPWFFLLPIVWIGLLVELYDNRRATRRADTIKGIGIAALVGLGMYLLIFFLSEDALPRRGVAAFVVFASVLTLAWRLVFISVFTAPQFLRRVLIVGAGKSGQALLNVINEMQPQPFQVVGLIDDDPEKQGKVILNYPVLGGSGQLLEIVERELVTDVILCITGDMTGATFQAILDTQDLGVDVTTMPIIYEELMSRVPIFILESDWLLRSFIDQARMSAFYEVVKRIIDVVVGSIGLLALALIFPLISFCIVIDSGFPIFFTQNRMGKRGSIYKIFKFRTMHQDSEQDGRIRVTTENDVRITKVGSFLRKSHIDELPQVINVILGDMSVVGPRAERSELVMHLQNNIPFYRARLLVKPGITGWAQVNFGYAATLEDTAVKLEYDLYYIKHRSLMLDILIMLRTVGTVIGLRGT